uniref:DNA replication licensing factor MCM3 n=1 Tax=Eutreptiella gymnastica TaxID=73025 RepID=A0A7S1HVJ4_9EUGL
MAQAPRDLADDQLEHKNWFHSFLESPLGRRTNERIDTMISADETRCIVNFSDIREYSEDSGDGELNMADRVQRRPNDYLPYWGLAVAEAVERRAAADYLKKDFKRRVCQIGGEGPVGAALVNPRTLKAAFMGQLVMVDGIVTRCSVVRPKLHESVHYSEAKNEFQRREYRDELSPFIDSTHLPTVNVFPKRDADGNPLRTEYGLCSFSDHQTVTLQEMPESAPVGQLPRSVDVRLEDDLVDKVKPGDRVRICGVYQAYTNKGQPSKGEDQSIKFQTVLVGNNVIHLGKKLKEPTLTTQDRSNIAKLVKAKSPPELLRFLAEGIAPSIFGLEQEKQAILLMLLGGEERKLEHTRIRGDMNILLVGEPSTAKSQLLRFVLNIAPLALSTTGRGSSGVGLTAAVTVDKDSGERTLSAGAMVLGDRGIVCIDEFDKMSDIDRVAMHEAMEQGSVTIAKAGIHASLNSRCSVLAAANPVYGFYVPQLKSANIGLPDSLQSRFDLIFIVLDKGQSSEHNKMIAAHVLDNHSSAKAADQCQVQMDEEIDDDDDGTTKPTEKFGHRKIVSVNFLRKYIQYAKANFHPVLNQEAHHEVVEAYVELRERMKNKDISTRITPRALENIIRLSTAHAKLRLSNAVEKVDVEAAYALIKHTMTMAADPEPAKRPRDAEGDPADVAGAKRPRADAEADPAVGTPQDGFSQQEQQILEAVAKVMQRETQMAMFQIRDAINPTLQQAVSSTELIAVLEKMDKQGLIAYEDGVAFRL